MSLCQSVCQTLHFSYFLEPFSTFSQLITFFHSLSSNMITFAQVYQKRPYCVHNVSWYGSGVPCRQTRACTNPLPKSLTTDWSWFEEFAIYTFAHCKSSSWLAWHCNQNRPPDPSRLPLVQLRFIQPHSDQFRFAKSHTDALKFIQSQPGQLRFFQLFIEMHIV